MVFISLQKLLGSGGVSLMQQPRQFIDNNEK